MAVVTLEGLTKEYPNGFTAVSELNLDIADAEFVVMVGPSGCGKSTTLRMIAGLEDISGGVVKIGERVVNEVPSKDRDIAMVFQNYALYPHMTVRSNMGFALKIARRPKDEINERVEDAARLLELTEQLDKKPSQLSGGQRQRVAMGRAIVRRPQVFLLDEPLSNLDAKLRVQMRAEITDLQQELGVTTFYVTHDQVEAMTMASRIAVMSAGKLQQIDSPQNLYDSPGNKFVAGFIGSPAMNFFSAHIRKEDGKLYVDAGEFSVQIPNEKAKPYQEYIDRQVTFGIRPEDIHNPDYAPPGITPEPVEAKVDVIELMGNEIVVYLGSGSHNYVARLDPRSKYRVTEKVNTVFDMDNMHIFDNETEEAVG